MICPGHATGILTEEERCSRWALFLPSAIFHAAGCKCGSMHKSGVQFAECLSAWPGPRVEELGGCRLAPCADRGLLEWWQMWSSLPFWSIWSSLRGLCSGATESQPQPEVVGRSPPIPGTAAGSDKKSSKQASRMGKIACLSQDLHIKKTCSNSRSPS